MASRKEPCSVGCGVLPRRQNNDRLPPTFHELNLIYLAIFGSIPESIGHASCMKAIFKFARENPELFLEKYKESELLAKYFMFIFRYANVYSIRNPIDVRIKDIIGGSVYPIGFFHENYQSLYSITGNRSYDDVNDLLDMIITSIRCGNFDQLKVLDYVMRTMFLDIQIFEALVEALKNGSKEMVEHLIVDTKTLFKHCIGPDGNQKDAVELCAEVLEAFIEKEDVDGMIKFLDPIVELIVENGHKIIWLGFLFDVPLKKASDAKLDGAVEYIHRTMEKLGCTIGRKETPVETKKEEVKNCERCSKFPETLFRVAEAIKQIEKGNEKEIDDMTAKDMWVVVTWPNIHIINILTGLLNKRFDDVEDTIQDGLKKREKAV